MRTLHLEGVTQTELDVALSNLDVVSVSVIRTWVGWKHKQEAQRFEVLITYKRAY